MAGVVPNVAEPFLLDQLRTYRDTWSLCLFVNNITPGKDTILTDLTEATFPGYARQATTSWSVASESADKARSQDVVHAFTRGSGGNPQTVYGYFFLDASGNLMPVEKAPTPVTLTLAGDVFVVLPKVSLNDDPLP